MNAPWRSDGNREFDNARLPANDFVILTKVNGFSPSKCLTNYPCGINCRWVPRLRQFISGKQAQIEQAPTFPSLPPVQTHAQLAGATAPQTEVLLEPTNQLPQKTVLAWIEGNQSAIAEFILRGKGKGAVNAVSAAIFQLQANATDAQFVADPAALAEHKRLWQEGTAKQLGIRTYPMIGYGNNISGLRTLFQPAHQARVIADIVAAVKSSDVDGVNIDFEPETDVHDHANNPTVADGVAFSDFLQALGKALHALPGRRRQLSMDSESVSGACWSDSGEDQNPPHTWNRKPCPWIRSFWNLDACSRATVRAARGV